MPPYLRQFDIGITIPIVILGILSMLAIGSAEPKLLLQQAIWFGIGFALFVCCMLIDFRPLVHHRGIVIAIYIIALILLVVTLIVAPVVRGTRSWIPLGPVQFQTSEFAKIALIVALSYFLAKRHIGLAYITNIIIPLIYTGLIIGLILAQPDMGSAMIIGGILVGYFFVSGLPWRHVLLGLLLGIIGAILAWNFVLATYQKERILGLFFSERDPLGVNYSVIQSKIAVGSGGWLGKGFRQGTQVQLGFLPEAHNDFVLATIVEEWGLLGGLLAVGTFLFLVLRIGMIGLGFEHNFSRLFVLGTMMMFLLQFTFNVGSTLALFPVIGVSLPFISYGGSNLLVNFIALGMIQSIAAREMF